MDKKIIFFLILAFSFLLKGIFSLNLFMQSVGIIILLIIIYDKYFNSEENKKFKKFKSKNLNFVGMFGNIDLTFGILLLIMGLYGIIPMIFIFVLAFVVFSKALVFVGGGDVASMLDILSVIIIFSMISVEVPIFVIVGISLYFIQKGVLSFFS